MTTKQITALAAILDRTAAALSWRMDEIEDDAEFMALDDRLMAVLAAGKNLK